jgi:hypothetical protein
MRSAKFYCFLTVLLALAPAAVRCGEEIELAFKYAPYPMEIRLAPAYTPGAELYETGFSNVPSAEYNVVLIEGVMPDPKIELKIRVRDGIFFRTYSKTAGRRFPNGRFWTKYRIGAPVRQPLQVVVMDSGVTAAHTLTIYGIEALHDHSVKEAQKESNPVSRAPVPVKMTSFFGSLPDAGPRVLALTLLDICPVGVNDPFDGKRFMRQHTSAAALGRLLDSSGK